MARKTKEQVKSELDALGISYDTDDYEQLYQLLKGDQGDASSADEQLRQLKQEAEKQIEQKNQPKRRPSPEEIAVKTDRLVKVKFTNIESPKATHYFVYGGKQFELKDGQEAELPVCVVNHLNSIRIPVREYDENAPEGQQVKITRMHNRFSLIPTGGINVGV